MLMSRSAARLRPSGDVVGWTYRKDWFETPELQQAFSEEYGRDLAPPQTLEELSQVYDVSRERIRQIEVRAFEKVQKAMKAIAGERLLPGVA